MIDIDSDDTTSNVICDNKENTNIITDQSLKENINNLLVKGSLQTADIVVFLLLKYHQSGYLISQACC